MMSQITGDFRTSTGFTQILVSLFSIFLINYFYLSLFIYQSRASRINPELLAVDD